MILAELMYSDHEGPWAIEVALPLSVIPAKGARWHLDLAPGDTHSFVFRGIFLVEDVTYECRAVETGETGEPGKARVEESVTIDLLPLDEEARAAIVRLKAEREAARDWPGAVRVTRIAETDLQKNQLLQQGQTPGSVRPAHALDATELEIRRLARLFGTPEADNEEEPDDL